MKPAGVLSAASPDPRLPYLLVAQQDHGDRQRMRQILCPRFEIKTIDNGFDVLSQVLYRKPDLLLLDLELPGIPGLEVIHALQSTGQDIAIIATVGAERRSEDWLRAKIMGAARLLRRPISQDELIRWVQLVLNGKHSSARSLEADDAAALLLDCGYPKVVDMHEFERLLERAQRMDRNYDQDSSVLLLQSRNRFLRDRITTVATEVLRSGDFILPYRGEKLAVLLPLTGRESVPAVLERLGIEMDGAGIELRQLRCAAVGVEEALECEWSRLFGNLVPWNRKDEVARIA